MHIGLRLQDEESIFQEELPKLGEFVFSGNLPKKAHFFIRRSLIDQNVSGISFKEKIKDYNSINTNTFSAIVNTTKLNDFNEVNDVFELSSQSLERAGILIGFVETYANRKKSILGKYPRFIRKIVYPMDALIYRIFPKLPITQKIYDFFTGGKGKLMSSVELKGRLFAFGFEIIDQQEISGYNFFVAKKNSDPIRKVEATYWPLIKLNRFGKDGKKFSVYKLRTMYPYSEFLQDYVYQANNLRDGGKFKDDFRVSPFGRILRKVWLDEIPMIWNWFKGDLKFVGVRPLSEQYFGLYSEELKSKRIRTKPGLLPPFYADLPNTLDEIMASELRYLDAYAKSPFKTDLIYFFKILKNILFKGARSG